MTAVTYHGEYPDGQADDEGLPFIVHEGLTFQPGKSVKVDDKSVLTRLATNRFFKLPDSDKEEIERGMREAEDAEIKTLKAWLDEHRVPYHPKSGLDKLRGHKADWLAAQEAVEE